MRDLYPSRVFEEPFLMERQDPVVYSGKEGLANSTLTKEEADFFEKNGFLQFDNLFTEEEINLYNQEFDDMRQSDDLKGREEVITEQETDVVRSIFYVHRLSHVYNKLSNHPLIKRKMHYLLGGDTYIHQSRINAKPAFHGKDFYWHSDFETWHVEDGMPRMRAISCLICLTENNEYNGALMVVPGSHKEYVSCVGATPELHYKSSLKSQKFGTPDDASVEQLYNEGGLHMCKGKVGSVIFFDCNLMHGSNSNISPFPRRSIFFVYNSVENKLVAPYGADTPRPNFVAEREFFEPEFVLEKEKAPAL